MRIVVDSYMVHYPLGGMLSWVLQYLVGFHHLGHELYFVEKSPYEGSCYDPQRDVMTDDCSAGVATMQALLARFGLGDRWCYVDSLGTYHGLSRSSVRHILRTADVFVELGTYGHWFDFAEQAGVRVLVDPEPGFTQIVMQKRLDAGRQLNDYDYYYSDGLSIGTAAATIPQAGRRWRPLPSPVVCDLFSPQPVGAGAPFTTVMNWRSHKTLEYDGKPYGQKDMEFATFLHLPTLAAVPLEVAVSGRHVPVQDLRQAGWRVRHANDISYAIDSYWNYIRSSAGEFSVCKNVFVTTGSGWFSDRSGVYLANGRPVVLQETGWSAHLPCGEGLFAVRTTDEAAEALGCIAADYGRHASAARAIAEEFLDAPKLLSRFLEEISG